jgi:hypothetical protein
MQQGIASEVAQLRQAIEDECTALQHIFTGFAIIASHNVIHHKYEAIDQHRAKLAQHVGEEAATNEVIDAYNRVVVGKKSS